MIIENRTYTPHRRTAAGLTTVTVKRCCDACSEEVGDATIDEIAMAAMGMPLPSVWEDHGCRHVRGTE